MRERKCSGGGSGGVGEDQVIGALCDLCLRLSAAKKGGEEEEEGEDGEEGDKRGHKTRQHQVIPNNANVLMLGSTLQNIHRSQMAESCLNEMASELEEEDLEDNNNH